MKKDALFTTLCAASAAALLTFASVSFAASPPPDALTVKVAVDERPQACDPDGVLTRDVTISLTRNSAAGFAGEVCVGAPGTDAVQRLPFDLKRDKTAELSVGISAPANSDIVELTYPIAVVIDGKPYMDMDLYVVKGPAWRVIGPFPGGVADAHDTVFPPEKELNFTAAYVGKDDAAVRWLPLKRSAVSNTGFVDLNIACQDVDLATAYATLDVYAPKEMKARLLLGSDDSCKAWLNGEQIHSNPIMMREAKPAQDTIDITLRRGKNTFLLKICDNFGGWGFHFDLVDADGKPLDDLMNTVAFIRTYLNDPKLTLTAVTRDSATVTWRSDVPTSGQAVVRKAVQGRARPYAGPLPRHDMVKADPNAKPIIVKTDALGMSHEATVTGLEPGTRYLISAEPAIGGQSSPPLSFYTAPVSGKMQLHHLRIICIIFTNGYHRDFADREDAKQPVDDELVQRIQEQFKQTQLFYYVNSGMRMFPEVVYIIDDTPYEMGDEIYGVGDSPHNENNKLLFELLAERGETPFDYDGVIMSSFVKKWDPRANDGKGDWFYPHGGGGTLGVMTDTGLGRCTWRSGTDSIDAWLMCHEFQHQLDALYYSSMQPDHLFNHFQPWDDTAHRHGEHWDGNGWIFWEWAGYVTREHQYYPLLEPTLGFRYFTNRWGTVVELDDADNDGVPDDAPQYPLDEKRLGSSPHKVDTDGDGLSDQMEIMACRWLEYGLGASWAGDPKTHHADPTNPDSDGDGLKDGVDPYPVYAIPAKIKEGDLQDFVAVKDKTFHAQFQLAWDEDYLTIRMTAPKTPRDMRWCLDLDDDGWYVGHDNYDIYVRPFGGATTRAAWHANEEGTVAYAFHNCGVKDKWPFYEAEGLEDGEIEFVQEMAEDGYTAEARIPRNEANGLKLVPGEKIGILLNIMPQGGIQRPGDYNALSVFEPHSFFTFELAR